MEICPISARSDKKQGSCRVSAWQDTRRSLIYTASCLGCPAICIQKLSTGLYASRIRHAKQICWRNRRGSAGFLRQTREQTKTHSHFHACASRRLGGKAAPLEAPRCLSRCNGKEPCMRMLGRCREDFALFRRRDEECLLANLGKEARCLFQQPFGLKSRSFWLTS